MKLNSNTLAEKVLRMKTEITVIDATIDNVNKLMVIKDELEFMSALEKTIQEFPKLVYFNEEIDSIKECLIDVMDGYEKREDVSSYMHFMKKVVQNTKDYF